MFMTTTEGGDTFAFPNVCNTPSASGTITIPYVSMGGYDDADTDTTSSKVKVSNKYVCTTDTEISSTNGDEAGTSGGVISGDNGDIAKPQIGSVKVNAEGSAVTKFLDLVGSNGDSANAYGAQISPSQTKVVVML